MRTTTRRRNRLRSASNMPQRWSPPTTFVVLAVGLLIGLALGFSNRMFDQSVSLQQHYLLLVSDLYAQGMPLANVRDRMLSVGYANPSVAVGGAADQLARSPDPVSQHESEQLRQFANALLAGPGSPTAAATQPVTQAAARPTSIAPSPTRAVTAVAVVVPTSTATSVPTKSPVPTLSARTTSQTPVPEVVAAPPTPTATPAPPTPRPTPKATAAPAKPGVIHTADGKSAVLRTGASVKTTAVAVLPDGAKILVYGSMAGEALEPPDATWYHVVYNGKQGYVYSKQVKIVGSFPT